MKKFQNSIIFLTFFILWILSEPIYAFFIEQNSFNLPHEYIINSELETLKEEYQQLLKEKDIVYPYEQQEIYTLVLYRDITNFYDEIRILKGTNQKIKEKSAVVNNQGFVGTIDKVNDSSSIVRLLTNKNTTLSVKIGTSYGVLISKNNELWINNITSKEEFKKSDIVYTSGFTNIPGNIKVGEVSEITKDSLGLITEIKVAPYVDFEHLNYLVILQERD